MEQSGHKLMYFVQPGRIAKFNNAVAGVLYYDILTEDGTYQFSVDMNDTGDVGSATFPVEINAVTLMRYIRKAIERNEFYKTS